VGAVHYPLATSSWDALEVEALQEVIRSGQYTMAGRVSAFESEFAAYHGMRHAVMVNSGSSANLLMAAALTLRRERPLVRGDEVIVPAVSWPTTYYPFSQYGLKLKFVDIDAETLNYDLDALSRALSERTRAVVAVNLLGNPNDFALLNRLLEPYGAVLIEDNCESLGAEYGGQRAGSFGLMSSASSFFSHHISTMEGGMVLTNDEELHHILLCLRAHGWTRNLPKHNHVCTKGDDDFVESFRFVLPGYNVRPLEMSGAVGSVQLKKLPRFIEQRRHNARVFVDALAGDPRFRVQRELGQSSWFGFSLVIRPEAGLPRVRVIERLRASGIECRPIVAGNFVRNPVVQRLEHEVHEQLSAADWIDENGFFVGNQEVDCTARIAHLARVLQEV
jgi:CDP-4-dehydro-6-deoxyglucose reductase, E1